MNETQLTTLLLAQGRLDAMSRSFLHERMGSGFTMITMVLLIVAISTAVILMTVRRYSDRRIDSRKRLFNELCRANDLNSRHRDMLIRIAKTKQLLDPTVLFIRSELWEGLASDPQLNSPKSRRVLNSLRHTLFREQNQTIDSVG